MLPDVVLKFVDAILTKREGFADINGGGVVFDKQKDAVDSLWDVCEGLRSDDGFFVERGVEPQVEDVVCHAGKHDEAGVNDS